MKNITTSKDPSIIRDLAEKDYRPSSGLSQSSIKDFLITPSHYLARCEEVREPTPAMVFGTCFHSIMLDSEPCYAIKKKVDGRTADGKKYNADWEIENAGKIAIDEEQHKHLLGMKEAVLTHQEAGKMYRDIVDKEVAVYATADTEFGSVRLKGKFDAVLKDNSILDFKKTTDASPEWASKVMRDYSYDIQQAQYLWLANANGKPAPKFYFCFVEDKPPYAVGLYTIDTSKKKKWSEFTPNQIWEDAVVRFAECQSTGTWAGYSQEVIELLV